MFLQNKMGKKFPFTAQEALLFAFMLFFLLLFHDLRRFWFVCADAWG